MARSDRATTLHPQALKAALARLAPEPVEVRETHISWVFLAGDRAYKLKKAVRLPFLDYGSPARRRRMCLEEVRLNRRLAPDIYLGVRSVLRTRGGLTLGDESDSGALDYVVEMRRYNEGMTLAAKLDRGELRRQSLARVGDALASFHSECRPVRGRTAGGDAIAREVEQNLNELLAITEMQAERRRIHSLARFMAAFVDAHNTMLDARGARGMTREGHGDLRAEHVVLERQLSVVDCVEFDLGLRTLDVADDLAFLVMDLAALGGERFGHALVEAYRRAGGDCGSDALLSFFAVHRALVRAKVLLVRSSQLPASSAAHGHSSAQARDLLALAARFAWRARLPLVLVVCGLPASGKSHLASALATASGLARLSSDLVRKELAGIKPTRRAGAEHYSAQFSKATYAELGRRAAREVAKQGGVLVDATFRHRADRDSFARAFADAAPVVFVECVAPPHVSAERAIARSRDATRVSDADLEVVLQERSSWQPLDEVPGHVHLSLRTDRPLEAISTDLAALLDQRLRGTYGCARP